MKVSIITVCKDSEKTIDRAIQSVLCQTYSNIEYIIIDGSSQDGTRTIIDRYRPQLDISISEPDSGVYQAMNKGVRQATGEWLYFVNSDDYLFDADVIQDLVTFISQHPDCDFVYGDHEARYTTGQTAIHQPVPSDRMLEEMVSLGECMIQPACFFRATLFEKVGLFNEAYKIAADYEWFVQLLQAADLRLCYYPRTLVSYAHGGLSGNIPALFAEVFAIQNQIPLYQKEPWLSQRTRKLQQSFIDKYDLLERTNTLSLARLARIEFLEAQVEGLESRLAQTQTPTKLSTLKADNEALKTQVGDLQARIAAMETSKFWKLRSAWFKLKRRLGLPTDRE